MHTYLLSERMLKERCAVPCFNAAYGTAKMELPCDWPAHGAADNFLCAHLHQALNPGRKSFTNPTFAAQMRKLPLPDSLFSGCFCACQAR